MKRCLSCKIALAEFHDDIKGDGIHARVTCPPKSWAEFLKLVSFGGLRLDAELIGMENQPDGESSQNGSLKGKRHRDLCSKSRCNTFLGKEAKDKSSVSIYLIIAAPLTTSVWATTAALNNPGRFSIHQYTGKDVYPTAPSGTV